MNREISVFSPAKINLHLDIRARRDDGYHEILSLFHKIDLYDEITICSLKNETSCFRVLGDFDCPEESNLVYRAAELFNRRTGLRNSYEFQVKKSIPAGAGLGGGSGNAAVVLEALNRLNWQPLSREELFSAAALLGSDVPFFLGGPAALAAGRGEELEFLEPLKGYEVLLVFPEFASSTAEAYRLYDAEDCFRQGPSIEEIKDAYRKADASRWPFFNSFKGPIYSRFPMLSMLEKELLDYQADYVSLSGSGSAIFGLFSSPEAVNRAFAGLKRKFPGVWKRNLLAN